MLTEFDLLSEIEKYNAKKDLTPDECIRLAAFYTILEYQFPMQQSASMSTADTEHTEKVISVSGENDFLSAIDGKNATQIWAVMSELMETLQVINPRLYDGVMRKINA